MRWLGFIALVLGVWFAEPVRATETLAIDEPVTDDDGATAGGRIDAGTGRPPSALETRFRTAQTLRYEGSFVEAIQLLDTLRAEYPQNVDYAFERALCYAAIGDDSKAFAEVQEAIRLAPGYEDLWRLRFRLLARDASLADQDTFSAWLEEAETRFPESTWSARRNVASRSWVLTVGGSYDRLDRGFDDWNRQVVSLARTVKDTSRHAIELSRNARSSLTDYALGMTADYQLQSNWLAGAYLGLAADTEFMPEQDLLIHGGRVLAEGWVVDAGVRYRSFSTADVVSGTLMVEKYVSAFRAAYRFSVSSLPDTPSFNGHGLTLNWYYSDVANVGLAFGTGREIESLGGGRLLETDVTSLSVTGRHGVTDRVSIDWWLGMLDQGDLYRRRFLGLAVSIQL